MNQRKPAITKGFTLIELMTVVAVIGILAAVAIPGYNDYTGRAQVSEAFVLVGPVQRAVVDYYARSGRFPDDNTMAGVPEPTALRGRFVRKIEVKQGGMLRVEVHPTSRASPLGAFYLRPVVRADGAAGTVQWVCNNATKIVSEDFKLSGEIGKDLLKDNVLAASCRGGN